MKAISVRQPWAWLLFHGKPVENRDWWTSYRGPLAIHASAGMTRAEYLDAVDFVRCIAPDIQIPHMKDLTLGAIIGTVSMIGCVQSHPSPFFQGKYGHVYGNQREFEEPIKARGALGLWEWPGRRSQSRSEIQPKGGTTNAV